MGVCFSQATSVSIVLPRVLRVDCVRLFYLEQFQDEQTRMDTADCGRVDVGTDRTTDAAKERKRETMSTLKGFTGKTFYAAAQPALDNTGNQRVMGCLGFLVKLCLVGVVVIVLYKVYEYYQTAQDAPQAVIPPNVADVPIAPAMNQTDVQGNAIRNPGITPCVAVNADCGSIATPSYKSVTGQTPVIRHAITSDERKALAIVYPTSAPIPVGVDSACFYAEKFNVSCDDVKSATAQMLQWQAEEESK